MTCKIDLLVSRTEGPALHLPPRFVIQSGRCDRAFCRKGHDISGRIRKDTHLNRFEVQNRNQVRNAIQGQDLAPLGGDEAPLTVDIDGTEVLGIV